MEKYRFKGSLLTRDTIISLLLQWGLPQKFFSDNPDKTLFTYENIIFHIDEFKTLSQK